MKTLVPSLLLGFLSLSLSAQKAPVKFGDVSREEISMTTYDRDSTASAVILADYGVSAITYRQNIGFLLDFERITRIKILTKEGLSWGNFTIPLYKRGADDEKLSGLKAVTYNLENGKIVESKLKDDGIFKEEYDANWNQIKVTCPNVKEGSVVEITYNVTSPFLINFQDWSFQSTIPTVMSEYRAQIPEFFVYDKYTQGYIALDITEEKKEPNAIRETSFERSGGGFSNVQSTANTEQLDYMDSKFRWAINDVPAFRPEPYMTSVHDYISQISFELSYVKYPNQPIKPILGNWKDINETMLESENFGLQVTGNGFLKKSVDEITAGASSAEEKIAAVVHYIKQNIVWDGRERMYATGSLRKVIENKKGTSAEINLLLASMLEKAGIQVTPVMLSTRSNGLLRIATPVVNQFNYVICLVEAGGKSWLLDATEKLLPIGMLPERCLNGQGFAIAKQGFQWVPLDTKVKTRSVTSGEFTISESGELLGKLKVDCNGYAALRNRKKYLLNGETEFLKSFVGSHQWEVKSTAITNATEIQNNFTQEHELVVNENIMVAGDVIYLDPFLHSSQKENPFKSEVRQYPVDFGSPMEETFFLKLTVPDNYTVDELPESRLISLPENAARYIYNVMQTGDQITVTSMFYINRSLFTQLDYPNLREFYNQVVAKQAEQIVLKKKL